MDIAPVGAAGRRMDKLGQALDFVVHGIGHPPIADHIGADVASGLDGVRVLIGRRDSEGPVAGDAPATAGSSNPSPPAVKSAAPAAIVRFSCRIVWNPRTAKRPPYTGSFRISGPRFSPSQKFSRTAAVVNPGGRPAGHGRPPGASRIVAAGIAWRNRRRRHLMAKRPPHVSDTVGAGKNRGTGAGTAVGAAGVRPVGSASRAGPR